MPGQKKFVRKTSSSFSNFVAREAWGCVWGVSHVEIGECDLMGAIAKAKLKFLLPPEQQWSVSLATIFHGVLIMKLPFPCCISLPQSVSAFWPRLGLFVLLGRKKKINQIRSNLTLQIPALLNSWVLGKVWIN